MVQNKTKFFIINTFIIFFGVVIIYFSIYLGLKNYFGVIYIVHVGATLLAFGIFVILVAFYLFFYSEYWNVIKDIFFHQILVKYKWFWILIIGFLGILFLSNFLATDIYNILRSVPVFPIQIFEFSSIFGEGVFYTSSIILRYTVGLWLTVLLWHYLLNKFFNKKKKNPMTKTDISLNNKATINLDYLENLSSISGSFSKINNFSNKENEEKRFNKSSKIRNLLFNKYSILFVAAFLLRFFIYLNANPGYDTGYYLYLAKDVVKNNNFNIFFDNTINLTALPTCIPLIGLSYLTAGDPLIAATIYFPILSVIIIYLTTKIIAKATNSTILPFLTAIFLSFSIVQFILISGLYKQITTICITLIIIYLLFFSNWKSLPKSILSILLLGFLLLINLFYFLITVIFFLIFINYLLIKPPKWAFFNKNQYLSFILKITFLIGVVIVAGGTTYLYFNDAFPFIDLSFYFSFILGYQTLPMSDFWTVIYNNIILFTPFILLLFFAIYGFINDFRKSHFINQNFQLFLRISFIVCLIFVLSNTFNFNLYRFDLRFLIYFEFLLVVYASIGIVDIYSIIKARYLNIAFFRKSKKLFFTIFIFCLMLGAILSIPFFRLAALAPYEKDAINWLLKNGKTEKLTNNLNSDVVIVSNDHLLYWIQYYIYHNAISTRRHSTIGTILKMPVGQFIEIANETIYFLVSKIRTPLEMWQDSDVINYIIGINETLSKNYYLIYNNTVVSIYEIEIFKD